MKWRHLDDIYRYEAVNCANCKQMKITESKARCARDIISWGDGWKINTLKGRNSNGKLKPSWKAPISWETAEFCVFFAHNDMRG